jgi:ferredoxin
MKQINQAKCVKCGRCVDACTESAISWDNDNLCIDCNSCFDCVDLYMCPVQDMCPVDAIEGE